MKKVLLLFIGLLTVGILQAQISVGPMAGINLSTVTTETDIEIDKPLLLGANIGMALNAQLGSIFSIQPELHFSQQGVKVEFKDLMGDKFTQTVKTNYLNLPILAKLTFGKEEDLRFYVNAGPYVGYWMSGKFTFRNETKNTELSGDFDFDEGSGAERFDVGLAAGGGLLFKAGPGNLMIDARYSLGLTAVSDDSVFDAGSDNNTNSVISISAGYLFPIGGSK